MQGRVVGPKQLRPEHDLEVGPVVHGEGHVRHADLEEVAGAFPGVGERVGQEAVALGRQGGEEPGLVAEVVRRRRVGDADASGEVAQAQRCRTVRLDGVDGSGEQGPPQIAVVVRALRHRGDGTTESGR
jgi:hypothetical protein